MKLLNYEDFKELYINEIKSNYRNATKYTLDKAYDIYESVINEEVNRNMNREEQESMATMLMQQLHLVELEDYSSNELLSAETKLKNLHSDIKHLSYFDNFLYEGASKDILSTLQQYNLPTEILKRLKPNMPFDENVYTDENGNTIIIYQQIEKDPSTHIVDFKIYRNGEIIFDLNKSNTSLNSFDNFNDYDRYITEYIKDMNRSKQYTKTIRIAERAEIDYDFTYIDEYQYERINKNNIKYIQTVFRNSKGQFTKNPYRI